MKAKQHLAVWQCLSVTLCLTFWIVVSNEARSNQSQCDGVRARLNAEVSSLVEATQSCANRTQYKCGKILVNGVTEGKTICNHHFACTQDCYAITRKLCAAESRRNQEVANCRAKEAVKRMMRLQKKKVEAREYKLARDAAKKANKQRKETNPANILSKKLTQQAIDALDVGTKNALDKFDKGFQDFKEANQTGSYVKKFIDDNKYMPMAKNNPDPLPKTELNDTYKKFDELAWKTAKESYNLPLGRVFSSDGGDGEGLLDTAMENAINGEGVLFGDEQQDTLSNNGLNEMTPGELRLIEYARMIHGKVVEQAETNEALWAEKQRKRAAWAERVRKSTEEAERRKRRAAEEAKRRKREAAAKAKRRKNKRRSSRAASRRQYSSPNHRRNVGACTNRCARLTMRQKAASTMAGATPGQLLERTLRHCRADCQCLIFGRSNIYPASCPYVRASGRWWF